MNEKKYKNYKNVSPIGDVRFLKGLEGKKYYFPNLVKSVSGRTN